LFSSEIAENPALDLGLKLWVIIIFRNVVSLEDTLIKGALMNEIGGACSADGGGKRRVQGFGGET
jgi:hypothetical protein